MVRLEKETTVFVVEVMTCVPLCVTFRCVTCSWSTGSPWWSCPPWACSTQPCLPPTLSAWTASATSCTGEEEWWRQRQYYHVNTGPVGSQHRHGRVSSFHSAVTALSCANHLRVNGTLSWYSSPARTLHLWFMIMKGQGCRIALRSIFPNNFSGIWRVQTACITQSTNVLSHKYTKHTSIAGVLLYSLKHTSIAGVL